MLAAGRWHDPQLSAGCDPVVAWSLLLPLSHLLLLRLAPPRWYAKRRTAVAVAYRLAYLACSASAAAGLGRCPVGSYTWPSGAPRGGAGADAVRRRPYGGSGGSGGAAAGAASAAGEAVFSALLWRSGVIAQCWYALAFGLLFAHFVPVQLLFFATYARRLAGAACADFGSVRHGAAVIGGLARAMGRARDAVLLAHGVTASAAPQQRQGGGAEDGPGVGCVEAVTFVQFAVGFLLPAFVCYCAEARARAAWLRRERAAAKARLWAAAVAEAAAGVSGSGASGSGSSSSSSSGGSTDSLQALGRLAAPPTPAAVAAAAAAVAEADGAADTAAPAVPRAPSALGVYALAAAVVAAWMVATGELRPPPPLLLRAWS